MIIRGIDEVYEIVPPYQFDGINNRSLPDNEMAYLRVTGITLSEQDLLEKEALLDANRYEPSRRTDEQQRRIRELVKAKIVSIHNHRLADGREITTVDELFRVIDRETRDWLYLVLNSAASLNRSERRNFLAPSASPST